MRSFSLGKQNSEPVINAEPVAAPQARPVTPSPVQVSVADTDRETIICDDIHIRGDLHSQEKLLVEGTIEGELRGGQIEIGEKGRVTGSIVGNTITVRGRVEGTITATTVQLAKTAVVEGDILHQGIGIEMGTHYDGRLKWNGEPKGTARTVEALKQSAQNGMENGQSGAIAFNSEATAPRS